MSRDLQTPERGQSSATTPQPPLLTRLDHGIKLNFLCSLGSLDNWRNEFLHKAAHLEKGRPPVLYHVHQESFDVGSIQILICHNHDAAVTMPLHGNTQSKPFGQLWGPSGPSRNFVDFSEASWTFWDFPGTCGDLRGTFWKPLGTETFEGLQGASWEPSATDIVSKVCISISRLA